MSSSRTNLTRTHLTLDEQSFQGLLSAAFTIQEHNDRRKLARQIEAEPEAYPETELRREPEVRPESEIHLEPEGNTLCPHCGAPKPAEAARCQTCGLDEFRPGERMQRNWASMWLMSQEQGLWLDRPAEVDDVTKHEVTHEDIQPVQAKRRPTTPASVKVASNGFLTVPDAAKNVAKEKKDVVEKTNASEKIEAFHQSLPAKSVTRPKGNGAVVDPALDYPQLDKAQLGFAQLDDAPPKRKWPIKVAKDFTPEHLTERDLLQKDLVQEHLTQEDLAQDSGPTVQSVELSTNHNSRSGPSYLVASNSPDIYPTDLTWEDAYAIDATSTSLTTNSTTDDTGPTSLLQRLANLRVTLRFHRADLYLGIAIFVAATALLWPAAASPRKATLSPWDQALVALGIAEAPAPAIHFQGDPGIEVWIDPHTALYYCPGEEPYGKTADGRLSSQREAQMERFEAASRSACE